MSHREFFPETLTQLRNIHRHRHKFIRTPFSTSSRSGLSAADFPATIQDRKKADEIEGRKDPGNPAQLKPAIIFGLLYAVILFVVVFTWEKFGESGLYVVAVLSGLTDVDAITLSTAQMMNKERIGVNTGWHLLMIATLANTLFKREAREHSKQKEYHSYSARGLGGDFLKTGA